MKKLASILLILVLLAWEKAEAHDKENNITAAVNNPELILLAKRLPIRVLVDDQVKGNCWTNVNATKIAVELELKRSGYKLKKKGDKKFAFYWLTLSAFGYNKDGLCVASWELSLEYTATQITVVNGKLSTDKNALTITHYPDATLWKASGVMSGGSNYVSPRLKVRFVESTQKFLSEIDELREKALKEVQQSAKKGPPWLQSLWGNFKLEP